MKYQTTGAFVITHKAKNRRRAQRQGEEFVQQMKDTLADNSEVESVVVIGYTDPKREQF